MGGGLDANTREYMAKKNILVADAGYIQAEILGMQGEIAQAQAAADRAVDLEYMDRESEFNAQLVQLQLLQPQLDKEESRYATAVSIALQQEQQQLAEQKQIKSDITNMKLNYINAAYKAGVTPDPAVMNQISNATSVDQAVQILGENMPQDQSGVNNILAGYIDTVYAAGKTLDPNVMNQISNATSVNQALQIVGANLPPPPEPQAADPITRSVDGNLYQWTGSGWQLAIQKGAEGTEPLTKTIGGQLYQWNPQTGGWDLAIAKTTTTDTTTTNTSDTSIDTGDTSTTTPTGPLTFDQFIQQKQEELGMSIHPDRYVQYQDEYDEIVSKQTMSSQLSGVKLSSKEDVPAFLDDLIAASKNDPNATYDDYFFALEEVAGHVTSQDYLRYLLDKRGITKSSTTSSSGEPEEDANFTAFKEFMSTP